MIRREGTALMETELTEMALMETERTEAALTETERTEIPLPADPVHL
jgi:hypothetical protein